MTQSFETSVERVDSHHFNLNDVLTFVGVKNPVNDINSTINNASAAAATANKAVNFIADHWLMLIVAYIAVLIITGVIAIKITK